MFVLQKTKRIRRYLAHWLSIHFDPQSGPIHWLLSPNILKIINFLIFDRSVHSLPQQANFTTDFISFNEASSPVFAQDSFRLKSTFDLTNICKSMYVPFKSS